MSNANQWFFMTPSGVSVIGPTVTFYVITSAYFQLYHYICDDQSEHLDRNPSDEDNVLLLPHDLTHHTVITANHKTEQLSYLDHLSEKHICVYFHMR